MPSRGKYIALFIINFFLVPEVILGLLSIGAFKTLNIAINNGDVAQAQKSAKKIRVIFIIGLILTILCIVGFIVLAITGNVAIKATSVRVR